MVPGTVHTPQAVAQAAGWIGQSFTAYRPVKSLLTGAVTGGSVMCYNGCMGRSTTTWKPGQSGNPAGRPATGESMREIMQRINSEKVTRDIDGRRRRVMRIELAARRLHSIIETGTNDEATRAALALYRLTGDSPDSGMPVIINIPPQIADLVTPADD